MTPKLLASLPAYAPTLALVPLFVAVIGAVGYPFFRRVMGFDHPTAFYSAMPGGLQDMLIFGAEAGGDVRAMSLVHATRVLTIVTVAPFVLTWAWGIDSYAPAGRALWHGAAGRAGADAGARRWWAGRAVSGSGCSAPRSLGR